MYVSASLFGERITHIDFLRRLSRWVELLTLFTARCWKFPLELNVKILFSSNNSRLTNSIHVTLRKTVHTFRLCYTDNKSYNSLLHILTTCRTQHQLFHQPKGAACIIQWDVDLDENTPTTILPTGSNNIRLGKQIKQAGRWAQYSKSLYILWGGWPECRDSCMWTSTSNIASILLIQPLDCTIACVRLGFI